MRKLPWILVVLLVIACVAAWFRPLEPLSAEIRTEPKIQTVVELDTVLISAPIAVFWQILPNDTIRIGDTLLHRKRVVYEDSLYRAVVSGYVDPRLSSRRRSVGDWGCKPDMVIRVVGMAGLG